MFAMIDVLYFAGGFALCWFAREPVTKFYKGAEDYAGMLKDKAESIINAAKK